MFPLFKPNKDKDARPLDNYLERYLAGTYQMGPEETGKLHVATTKESLASQKVTLFRIFDPSLMSGGPEKIDYAGLDEHKSSLQFEGRYAKNKTVTEIRDLRNSG